MFNTITIKTPVRKKGIKKFLVEINADQLERLAANFGFFNPEFLHSFKKAEADCNGERTTKITSLKELR